MPICIRCERKVKRIMSSTGTCRKCRDEELRDNADRILEEDGTEEMVWAAQARFAILKEMKENNEPDEAGWGQIEDFEYEDEYLD
ncbi:unnamed protein product [marine sediment metagenome]|uniref:Uncharacterized protein n=1 Tax=marine sediment metagenome TaxID=412755 RepID=X1SH05_9ZZZZ